MGRGRALGRHDRKHRGQARRWLLDDGTVCVVGVADPLVCGLGQPVLVQLGCAPAAVRQVIDVLSARADIRFLTLSTGNWDIIAEIIVPSQAQLVHALVDELGNLAGVHRSSSALITRNFTMRHHWSRRLLNGAAPGPIAPPIPRQRSRSTMLIGACSPSWPTTAAGRTATSPRG